VSLSSKKIHETTEPKMGARLNSNVPRRGPTETRDGNRNASSRERPITPD